jgi:hypothetical protein
MNFSYIFRKAMIKPENDRKAEGFTWPIFIFAVLEVECAITEIYLLLVARNLLKYMLLFIVFLLRHFALLVTSLSHRRLCRVKHMLRKAMIKPENDRKAEGFTWPIFIFAVMEVSIVSKIGRFSVSMGVEMVGIYKNVFFLKENHFTTQIPQKWK